MQDSDHDPLADLNASPLNPLPGGVWLLVAAMVAVEAVFLAGGAGLVGGPQAIGWRIAAIESYAYSTAIQNWMVETWRFPPHHLLRYVSYSFLHGGATHLVFSLVLIAAMGKTVGEAYGSARFLIAALLPPVLAAVIFGCVLGAGSNGWLMGAMPMVFGLVGAFTWIRWRAAGDDRQAKLRAFSLIGILIIARVAFGLLAEAGPAWIAELLAFTIGFGLSALCIAPGSWSNLRARLRG